MELVLELLVDLVGVQPPEVVLVVDLQHNQVHIHLERIMEIEVVITELLVMVMQVLVEAVLVALEQTLVQVGLVQLQVVEMVELVCN